MFVAYWFGVEVLVDAPRTFASDVDRDDWRVPPFLSRCGRLLSWESPDVPIYVPVTQAWPHGSGGGGILFLNFPGFSCP